MFGFLRQVLLFIQAIKLMDCIAFGRFVENWLKVGKYEK
jgi:hypothetical protein